MISLGERKCHEVGFLKSAFPNSWHTWLEHQSNPCFPRFSESRKFMKHGLECSLELGTPELDPVTSLKAWVSLSPSRSQAQETWEGLSNLSGSWNSYMFRILRGGVYALPPSKHTSWDGWEALFFWGYGNWNPYTLPLKVFVDQYYLFLMLQEGTETQTGLN